MLWGCCDLAVSGIQEGNQNCRDEMEVCKGDVSLTSGTSLSPLYVL